jgi:hypothetical protein
MIEALKQVEAGRSAGEVGRQYGVSAHTIICLESQVWGHGCERGARSETVARRECAAEAPGCRSNAGQRCIAIGDPKKLTGLVAKRAEVQRLKQEFDFSERHACELMSIPRSSFRYCGRRDDSRLREQLIELAREKPRFGYRRLHILLRRAGQHVTASM